MDLGERVEIEASRVGPKLWVGSFPSADLKGRGFDAVALCAAEKQNIEPNIPTLRVHLDDAEFTDDEMNEVFAHAHKAARLVSRIRRRGGRVLVTCRAGINRSALVAAISLMMLDGLSAEQAVNQIRNTRGPRTMEGWGMLPLSNKSFVRALQRYHDARRLRKARHRARALQSSV
jgi:protein tyrosine/serine phosphatase